MHAFVRFKFLSFNVDKDKPALITGANSTNMVKAIIKRMRKFKEIEDRLKI